jgi:hypothetical protein
MVPSGWTCQYRCVCISCFRRTICFVAPINVHQQIAIRFPAASDLLFGLEYTIRRVQVNREGLELNGTHLFVLCADDVNMLGRSVYSVKGNTGAWVVASTETGLDVNAERNMCMVMSRDQNAGRRHNVKIVNGFFERVEQFKYLGTTVPN